MICIKSLLPPRNANKSFYTSKTLRFLMLYVYVFERSDNFIGVVEMSKYTSCDLKNQISYFSFINSLSIFSCNIICNILIYFILGLLVKPMVRYIGNFFTCLKLLNSIIIIQLRKKKPIPKLRLVCLSLTLWINMLDKL